MEFLTNFAQHSSFYEFASLITLAAIAGFFANLFKQPLIIAFILIGILAGPSAFDFVQSSSELELLSKLGISVLLFIVGLKLDLTLIKSLGLTALVTGLVQMATTFALGYYIALLSGASLSAATYIGIAFCFSSTIIIVKMLSDKKEIDSMHGRIALGVLIVQDFAVVISMMVLTTLASTSAGDGKGMVFEFVRMGVDATILLIVIFTFMRFAALPLVSKMAKSSELLLCFALAWAFLLAALCDYIGLSKELGGLLAGISLASTPYREAIVSKLGSIRDFLLLFFFITLGAGLDLSLVGGQYGTAIVMALFILLFKPFIIFLTTLLMGYKPRTGFLAGLSLGQISEFSFIFMAMAVTLGMADDETLGLVTLVGMITIAVSTYGITLSHQIYNFCEPLFTRFEKKADMEDEGYIQDNAKGRYDVILFGMGRYGRSMANRFREAGKKILIVDFNPEVVRQYRNKGFHVIYGDACDPDFYSYLPLDNTKWVVSAMPPHESVLSHDDPRYIMMQALKNNNFKGRIGLATHDPNEVELLKEQGIDLVFLPFQDAAERAVTKVLNAA